VEISIDIDGELLAAARSQADEEARTLDRVVEGALRDALAEVLPPAPYRLAFPVVNGGPLLVDVADRDALYDLLDGREEDGSGGGSSKDGTC